MAASVFHWAAAGVIHDYPNVSSPRWTIVAIHLLVGILLLTRARSVAVCSHIEILKCLPSFMVGGMVVRLAGPMHFWPITAQVLFVISGLWTLVSLATLARSFAIFPALRKVVQRGPYRLVRHPVYVGEIGLIGGAAWAAGSAVVWTLAFAAVGTFIFRIQVEEAFLDRAPEYARYSQNVSWRILPGVW
jgi:protein-S-isoprenylcysteine O-methyltransferase Ste14